MSSTATQLLNATLIERRDIHEALAVFRVQPDERPAPAFEPGQFISVGLPAVDGAAPTARVPHSQPQDRRPKLVRRAYSIASPRDQRDALDFYLNHVPQGRLTGRLWSLREGDRLFLGGKIGGTFTLEDVPADRDVVLVATGTGVAPFRSMLLSYRGTGRWRRLVLVEGCRYRRDLGFYDEFTRVAQQDPTVIYLPTLTRETESDWNGLCGRVHEVLEPRRYHELVGAPLDPQQCHIFLCGNPAMIDECEAYLTQRGFEQHSRKNPAGNLHFERYW